MNPRKLMAVALCAAACVTTTTFAEDDFGIESASPEVIADPVNPQPGMVMNVYPVEGFSVSWERLQKMFLGLPASAAEKTEITKTDNFMIPNQSKSKIGRWEGFLKCKRATAYTFVVNAKGTNGSWDGYMFKVNGKTVIKSGEGKTPADVNLKIGWNKVEFIAILGSNKPIDMEFKPKGSLSDARPIGPKDMFYDKKLEEPW